jgi:flagellar biosynthesis/type III secretory pathway chaperone
MAVQDIVRILDEQAELYGQLLETANEKTPVLVKGDVDQLNAIVQKERKLIARAEQLEQQRILETHRHFVSLGYISRMNTLREVIQSVNQPELKQKLIDQQRALSGLLEELRRVNELNQQLIRQALAFIDYSIGLAVDDPAEDIVYQHPQKNPGGAGRTGIFDTRA